MFRALSELSEFANVSWSRNVVINSFVTEMNSSKSLRFALEAQESAITVQPARITVISEIYSRASQDNDSLLPVGRLRNHSLR